MKNATSLFGCSWRKHTLISIKYPCCETLAIGIMLPIAFIMLYSMLFLPYSSTMATVSVPIVAQ